MVGQHLRYLPYLQLDTAQIRVLLLGRGVQHLAVDTCVIGFEERAERFGVQAHVLPTAAKVCGLQFTPIEHTEHQRVHEDRPPLLHQVRSQRGMAMAGLMEKAQIGIQPHHIDGGKGLIIEQRVSQAEQGIDGSVGGCCTRL